MKMKKITAGRWAILAFVLVCLVAVFSTSGCSMLTDKMNQVKCGMVTCTEKETPIAVEDIRG